MGRDLPFLRRPIFLTETAVAAASGAADVSSPDMVEVVAGERKRKFGFKYSFRNKEVSFRAQSSSRKVRRRGAVLPLWLRLLW